MKVPYTNFKTFVNGEWKEVDTEEIFSDKKIIILAVPGAFTSEKSDKQVQEYENASFFFSDQVWIKQHS